MCPRAVTAMRTFSSVSSMMGVGVWVGVGVVAMGVAESGGGFGLTREATDNLRALSAISKEYEEVRVGRGKGREGARKNARENRHPPPPSRAIHQHFHEGLIS